MTSDLWNIMCSKVSETCTASTLLGCLLIKPIMLFTICHVIKLWTSCKEGQKVWVMWFSHFTPNFQPHTAWVAFVLFISLKKPGKSTKQIIFEIFRPAHGLHVVWNAISLSTYCVIKFWTSFWSFSFNLTLRYYVCVVSLRTPTDSCTATRF